MKAGGVYIEPLGFARRFEPPGAPTNSGTTSVAERALCTTFRCPHHPVKKRLVQHAPIPPRHEKFYLAWFGHLRDQETHEHTRVFVAHVLESRAKHSTERDQRDPYTPLGIRPWKWNGSHLLGIRKMVIQGQCLPLTCHTYNTSMTISRSVKPPTYSTGPKREAVAAPEGRAASRQAPSERNRLVLRPNTTDWQV